jgi:plasmid stabilization system protein ParE
MTSLSDSYTVDFTHTAELSVEDQIEHLAIYQGTDSALTRVLGTIDVAAQKLATNPKGYKICPQASELGVLNYRELNTDRFRFIYEIMEDELRVVVHLVLGEKQSVEDALVRNCLLLPLRPE